MMCSAFTPDCRYDKSVIKIIGNVYCPITLCSGLLCVLKRTSQSVSRSEYSVLTARRPVRFTLKNKQNHFDRGIYNLEETQTSLQKSIGDVYFPGRYCSRQNSGSVHKRKKIKETCYECLQFRAWCHVLNLPFKEPKPTVL